MSAIHVRNVPEPVVAALRERAAAHGQSMQAEIRQILAEAARTPVPRQQAAPIELVTVREGGTASWSREEIYDDTGR